MKKEILNLVNSEEGELRINQYFKLERWTKDALNESVDKLALSCNIVESSRGLIEIKSRDFLGIKEEISSIMQKQLDIVKEKLLNNFSVGYFN